MTTLVCKPLQGIDFLSRTNDELSITGSTYTYGIKGPKILVTAGMHGDEVTSIGALWYLEKKIERETFKGEVSIIPCVNPSAVKASSRLIPIENSDVNRSFPGRHDGSLAERIADTLVKLMNEYDVLIDVHTAGWCTPFIIVDNTPDKELHNRIIQWVKTTKVIIVGEMGDSEAELQGLDKSWSAWVLSKEKSACTFELPGFHKLEHEFAETGAEDLFTLIKNTEIVMKTENESILTSDILPTRVETYSNTAGIFESIKKPGDLINTGELIGWIKSLKGETSSEVLAKNKGIILALQPISAVQIGSWLVTIAS